MTTRHPPDEVLVRWLETGRPRRVGRHVEDCDECMERLDVVSDLDGGLITGLQSASAPPADLHARTTGGVSDRLAAEEALSSVLDLFTVPWRTAASILDPAPIGSDTPPTDMRSNDE